VPLRTVASISGAVWARPARSCSEVRRSLLRGSVEEHPGAVLVVGLGVVDDPAEPVALRGVVAPPAVVRLLREQFRLQPGTDGDVSKAGLGGGVAFGVDCMHVVAKAETQLGEAEEGFSFAGAGEAEDDGAEAEGGVGETAPLPRSPFVEVAAHPGAEHMLAVRLDGRVGGAASGSAEARLAFGVPSCLGGR